MKLNETQAVGNIILMDYVAFQIFPYTVKTKLKNQSIKVWKIWRLAFFFQWTKYFKASSKWAVLLSFRCLLTNPYLIWRLNQGLVKFDLKMSHETLGKEKKKMLKHLLNSIYGLYLCIWLRYLKAYLTQVKMKIITLSVTKNLHNICRYL